MRRLLMAAVLAAGVAGPAAAQSPGASKDAQSGTDAWLPRTTAEIIMLDKLKAQPAIFTIKSGQSATFGTLTVVVRSCQTRPADLPQNSAAFVEVTDSRGSAPVFRGWVLANTPSVSQFEHPVYDLRLVSCK